jgi:hypothetical protein
LDPQIEIGAMATADDVENGMYLHGYDDPDLKYGRRNRKHGKAVCPECNQSFVNTARLERHLSVHQVSFSYNSLKNLIFLNRIFYNLKFFEKSNVYQFYVKPQNSKNNFL